MVELHVAHTGTGTGIHRSQAFAAIAITLNAKCLYRAILPPPPCSLHWFSVPHENGKGEKIKNCVIIEGGTEFRMRFES